MDRDTSDVEVRALRLFQNELPDQCIVNEETQDKQHLDFTLHLREEGRPTGLQFGIQVKGTQERVGRRYISKKISRAHLEFWVDRSRLPVFLVVADVSSGSAHWLSIRDWARSAGEGWRHRSSTTLRVPRCNRVSDHETFVGALRSADLDSLLNSGGKALGALARVDERFVYQLRHSEDGGAVIEVGARERVEVAVRALGRDAADRIQSMLRSGRPQVFAPGELSFDGGPFFDFLQARVDQEEVQFQISADRDFHVSLIAQTSDGTRVRGMDGLVGRSQGGLDRVQFEAMTRDRIVKAHGFLERGDGSASSSSSSSGSLCIVINAAALAGSRLWELSGFEKLSRLRDALVGANSLWAQFTIDGEVLEPLVELSATHIGGLLKRLTALLDTLTALRRTGEKLGVNPVIPDLTDLSDDAFHLMGVMLRLCDGELLSVALRPVEQEIRLTVTMPLDETAQDQLADGVVRIITYEQAEFFGEVSEAWKIKRTIGPLRILGLSEVEESSWVVGGVVRLRVLPRPDSRLSALLVEADARA
jgi:hypothetical protein